jgi:hypothetical protein
MSYKLFTDKINKFECNLQVEGTSLTKSQARVILETNSINYLFKGKIYDNGLCEFELPKLKGLLDEGSVGTLRLEVIADDVHFEPWNSDFVVEVDKKVSVRIQEQEIKKPMISLNTISLTETTKTPEKKEPIKETVKKEPPKDVTTITKKDILEYLNNKTKS